MIPRHRAIEIIAHHLGPHDVVVSTTGMISRELFLVEDRPGNFYMLGSMGLASSFALGLALLIPSRLVYVIEGDGSALMSLGALPLIAVECPPNLVHVILDNEAYESTGGQRSISARVDLASLGTHSGYPVVSRPDDQATLEKALMSVGVESGPHLVVMKASISAVPGIPRVSHTVTAIRDRLVEFLGERP